MDNNESLTVKTPLAIFENGMLIKSSKVININDPLEKILEKNSYKQREIGAVTWRIFELQDWPISIITEMSYSHQIESFEIRISEKNAFLINWCIFHIGTTKKAVKAILQSENMKYNVMEIGDYYIFDTSMHGGYLYQITFKKDKLINLVIKKISGGLVNL